MSAASRPLALLALFFCSGPLIACTIFEASQGDSVLVGNNEDYFDDGVLLDFYPATAKSRGRLVFRVERNRYPFGGMNDRGLFFDWCALPRRGDIAFPPKRKSYDGILCDKMLAECSTVEEAIALYRAYNDPWLYEGHMLVADRTGASAVIEWGAKDLSVIRKAGRFQVLSNFNLGSPGLAGWYPCPRYDAAAKALSDAPAFTVDLFRRTLEAVRQEGANPTIHSEIYELDKGIVHVFKRGDFGSELLIDLGAELRKGRKTYRLYSLFGDIGAAGDPRRGTAPEALVFYGFGDILRIPS